MLSRRNLHYETVKYHKIMNILHCGWKITELFIARARFINKFHKNTLWTTTYVADNAFNVIFFNILRLVTLLNA